MRSLTVLVHLQAPWWRHQMEAFSALLALCVGNSPVTGEFPAQRPVTRNFNVFFDLRLNKWLSKQSWRWWFATRSWLSWCHNVTVINKSGSSYLTCSEPKLVIIVPANALAPSGARPSTDTMMSAKSGFNARGSAGAVMLWQVICYFLIGA